jgi:hypothetical protein
MSANRLPPLKNVSAHGAHGGLFVEGAYRLQDFLMLGM